jgi:hypothetical protein
MEVLRCSARPSCTANPRPNRNEKMVMNRPEISGKKAWLMAVSSQDASFMAASAWTRERNMRPLNHK